MLRGKVYEGSQFVFVRPEKDKSVKVIVKNLDEVTPADEPGILGQTGRKPEELEIKEPMVISLPGKSVHVINAPRPFRKFCPGGMPLCTLVTDRKIYRKNDPVKVFAFTPHALNTPIKLELRRNGHRLFTRESTFSAKGIFHDTIRGLDEGSYRVSVSFEGRDYSSSFTIAEYTLSYLQASLTSHTWRAGVLSFSLSMRCGDEPYTGNLKVGLYCDYCKKVVEEAEIAAGNGDASHQFYLQSHTGSFALVLTTPGGDSATVQIPGTRADIRDEVSIGEAGESLRGAAIPFEAGHKRVRGLYLGSLGENESFITLDSIIGRAVEVTPSVDLDQLLFVLSDPFGSRRREIPLRNVKKGIPIELEVPFPFTIFTAGGIGQDCHETFSLLMHPDSMDLTIDAPSNPVPGSEIEISIQSLRKGALMLIIADSRIERDDPFQRITENVLRGIRNNVQKLSSGIVKETFIVFDSKDVESGKRSIPGRIKQFISSFFSARNSLGSDPGPMPGKQMAISDSWAAYAADRRGSGDSGSVVQLMMSSPGAVLLRTSGPLASPLNQAAFPGLPPKNDPGSCSARLDFPEVMFAECFELDGEFTKKIKLGDQIGAWDIFAFLFDGIDYVSKTKRIEATRSTYVELDLPAFISPGDEIFGKILARSPGKASLSVKTPITSIDRQVGTFETLEIAIRSAGEVMAEIESGDEKDITSRTVGFPGKEKISVSQLYRLKQGEKLEGERILVYPGGVQLAKSAIDSLISYPFG